MSELQPIYVFCSANRAEMLHDSVLCAAAQTVPGRIVISVPGKEHVLLETLALSRVELVVSPQGLPSQRNAALKTIADREAIIFLFDDDVEIEEHYAERILDAYKEHPEIALMNGRNVARGAVSGSLTRRSAREFIRAKMGARSPTPVLEPARTGLGCRMSFPARLLGKVAFDERLALYGYQEDYEFSLQCAEYGLVVTNNAALMAHIETPAGRVGVVRRGYSEVVNPIYIAWKHPRANKARAIAGAVRRTFRNGLNSHRAHARKQLSGNLMGWVSVLSGSLDPERIVLFKD